MAIVKSGPYMGFSGTVDGITYYQLPDGRTCAKKKNAASSIPPTPAQISVKRDTEIFADFMKPLKEFVRVGYALEAKAQRKNPHNVMVKLMRAAILEGLYPNRYINYAKVLMTKGTLMMPAESGVKQNPDGFTFTWSTEVKPGYTHHSDQIMLLAYFPELKETVYTIGGAARYVGKDVLNLSGVEKGYAAAIYISFITNDRSDIADSKYLGQLIW